MEPWIVGAFVALNLIGGYGLVRWLRTWIHALQGNVETLRATVAAQEANLASIGTVNQALLDVFKALEPQRWAAEVEVHKKLADDRAAAMIERAQRELEREREQYVEATKKTTADAVTATTKEAVSESARIEIEMTIKAMVPYVGVMASFLPFVPKSERLRIIKESKLPDERKTELLRMAEETRELRPTQQEAAARFDDFFNVAMRLTRYRKAQDDVRALANGVSMYAAIAGKLPADLSVLRRPISAQDGSSAGPVLKEIPAPPDGWKPDTYAPAEGGTFTVDSAGDGAVVRCP